MSKHEGMSSVQRARIAGDHEALSNMGKKGGKQAAENRSVLIAKRAEAMEERMAELARQYSLSPEGDVLPPEEPTVH